MIKFKKQDWEKYQQVADKYLGRKTFSGTPLTGALMRRAAESTYNKTGILVPVELALAQAQFESAMARKGRNPATNPYNVGEYDSGTKIKFKDLAGGVQAYYELMANDYLAKNNLDGLLKSFVNYQGSRYASDPAYEDKLSGQIGFIRKKFMEGA